MVMEYIDNEHDKVLLDLVVAAKQSKGIDGISSNPDLRIAQAVEEYVIHRTFAILVAGLKKRDVELYEKVLIGAYVDGQSLVTDNNFSSPLQRGKPYRVDSYE